MTLRERILQHVKRHRGIASLHQVAQAWGVQVNAVRRTLWLLRNARQIRYLLHEHITLLVDVPEMVDDLELVPQVEPTIVADVTKVLDVAQRGPARLLRLDRRETVAPARTGGWRPPKNLVEPPGDLSPEEETRLLGILSFYAKQRREEEGEPSEEEGVEVFHGEA